MHEPIDFIAHFNTYLLTEKRVSPNTFASYNNDIEQLSAHLKSNKIKLQDATKKDLNNFLKSCRDQGLKAKTLSRKISSIKLFFTYLHERFKLANVAKALIFPKVEKTLPNYLSQPEVETLLLAANQDTNDKGIRNKVMLYLLYATGMRVSELVALTTDQLHFDSGFIRIIGKGSKERMVPLPRNILDLLRYYLDHIYTKLMPKKGGAVDKKHNYLFFAVYNDSIKPISRQSFWIILKKILGKAAILKNVSPHSLRHSLATHLLSAGADIRSLQMLLGHENLATVQVYTHLGSGEIRKVYDKKHPRA